MNTALILHLLAEVQRLIFWHPWRGPGWTTFQCWEQLRVVHRNGQVDHRLVCGLVHVWRHGVVMKWR